MRIFFLFSLLAVYGCTHSIHMVHAGDYDQGGFGGDYEIVQASSEQFVVMGFVTDTNYVDDAYVELQGQCPNGRIHGITTQFSTSHGPFSWKNKILMQGYCVGMNK